MADDMCLQAKECMIIVTREKANKMDTTHQMNTSKPLTHTESEGRNKTKMKIKKEQKKNKETNIKHIK